MYNSLEVENMALHILVVDDNKEIREIIQILLSGEGYLIDEAEDGTIALDKIKKTTYDLIILDIMMPTLNGYQTCIEIREQSNVPILFLSAKSQESDKTLGFSSGGDDYLCKPFSYNELLARVKAITRRYRVYQGKDTKPEEADNQNQGISIKEKEQKVYVNNKEICLTDKEYSLLVLLFKNKKQIFSTQQLFETIWKEEYYYGANNTIMVHIRNLRKKIEDDPTNPKIIKTIWGKGYRCD